MGPYFVSGRDSKDGQQRDFCDGQNCKESYPPIDIVLFYDDFQLSNPFGTKSKFYKMCGFY